MFFLSRLQQNFDAIDGYLSTLSSIRKDATAGVYSGSQGIENVYSNSASNEREGSVTVILLLCAYLLLFIKSFVAFHTEEINSYEKAA